MRRSKLMSPLTGRTPKYLWYYGAAILLVYFLWNYYTVSPINHVGSTTFGEESVPYEKANTLSFSNVGTNWLGDVSSEGAMVTKDVTTSVKNSVKTLSDRLGVPNYHSDSFEASVINSANGGGNLMTTPSYALSKSHILLDRQLPPEI